ncbi:MAG: MBL fold metallo-hydrolase [Desulfatibacillaceae bacterium]
MRDAFLEGVRHEPIFPDTESAGITLCALASGSKGNAVYVSDGATNILVDAGLSGKEIIRRMTLHGLSMEDVHAMVVSHEHIDHVRGVGVLARRFAIPAYFTRATWTAAPASLGEIPEVRRFVAGNTFPIGTLSVHPFSISHDAADPCGFTIKAGGVKVGIATDLGIATGMVRHHLRNCNALLLEANHDVAMLEQGPYPWPIKQRVKSRSGHLSNECARDLLSELLHDGLSHVILGHISQTNNLPEKALDAVRPVFEGHAAHVRAASQDVCGELLRLEAP